MIDISNPEEKRIITGPAGIYCNTRGQILGVIEREGALEGKSRKRAGQIFVPAGKKRPNETSMEDTLIRETGEETGIRREYGVIEKDKLELKGKVELETIDSILIIDVFEYKKPLETNVLEKYNKFFDHEIIQRTFFDLKEILDFDISKIRPGLYEILYLFFGGKNEERIFIEKGEYKQEDTKRIQHIKQEIKHLL